MVDVRHEENPCAYCHAVRGSLCQSWCTHRACTRCSRTFKRSGQLCESCYDERAKHTYWDRGAACRVKGPSKAECLLEPGHIGDHEGNGFDGWGPLGRTWKQRPLTTTTPATQGEGT